MQTASADFEAAANAASGRTLADPVLYANWELDGILPGLPLPGILHLDVNDSFEDFSIDSFGATLAWGPTWTQVGAGALSGFRVASGVGTILKGDTNDYFMVRRTNSYEHQVTWKFNVPQLATGAKISAYGIATFIDVNNWYGFRLDFNIDQVMGWGIVRMVGGVLTTLASGLVPTTDSPGHHTDGWYWVKGQVSNSFAGGSLLRMRSWGDGFTEPAYWDGQASDGSFFKQRGGWGTRCTVTAGNTNSFPIIYNLQHGSDSCIDNLSAQLNNGYSVSQGIDDGMPDEVSDQTVDPFGTFAASVTGRSGRFNNGSPETAGHYFSQFNPDSPVANYDRDTAPMTLEAGLITKSGPERLTVFTGRMSDVATDTKTASLTASSAANRQMQVLVTPPAINGALEGLTGTWPVTYALHKAGLYASPPPRPECRLWIPFHGSTKAMLPDTNSRPQVAFTRNVGTGQNVFGDPDTMEWVTSGPYATGVWPENGPYVEAAYCYGTPDVQKKLVTYHNILFGPGASMLSQDGNHGRIEFMIRADAMVQANVLNGHGSFPSAQFMYFQIESTSTSARFACGINSSRQVYGSVYDGTIGAHTDFCTHTSALPSDGKWYYIDISWSYDSSPRITVNINNLPQFSSTTTTQASLLPAFDDFSGDNSVRTYLDCSLPIAELQVSAGPTISTPSSVFSSNYWTPTAVVRPSQNRKLYALTDGNPMKAIDLVNRCATAELAMTRCDEQDLFRYMPLSYWVEDAQQALVDTYQSSRNISALGARRDVTRVRNSVSVGYKQTAPSAYFSGAYSETQVRTFSPGLTLMTVSFSTPVTEISNPTWFAKDVFGTFLVINPNVTTPVGDNSYVTCNDKPDGTGNYAIGAQLQGLIKVWTPTSAVIEWRNFTTTPLYLANNTNTPTLYIAGKPVAINDGATAPVKNPNSIARRSEIGMAVTLEGIRNADWATAMAGELCARLAEPRWRADNVQLVGDPRRQPGDLVRILDAENTELDGLGRVMSIVSQQTGANFTQTATVVQAWTVGIWDESLWDQALWGV